ncbi:hypothetical protein BDB00DRAFT_843515 [Zychaea mexicana]|uniref:uncharacterized protein n=1 Tax=Zychaea mexicana TaxID=64656 RepID=UPI0022FE6CA2|nr:uncharacterized protein BDB00DRAFT_843515 [Zychaea mexicana]KAI9489377.1 hypothetical protein BDB00DRAFT_843515 [Zychaea mexicana]
MDLNTYQPTFNNSYLHCKASIYNDRTSSQQTKQQEHRNSHRTTGFPTFNVYCLDRTLIVYKAEIVRGVIQYVLDLLVMTNMMIITYYKWYGASTSLTPSVKYLSMRCKCSIPTISNTQPSCSLAASKRTKPHVARDSCLSTPHYTVHRPNAYHEEVALFRVVAPRAAASAGRTGVPAR